MSIRPNADQFAELAAHPDDGPVVMLNLLKFKEQASESRRAPTMPATRPRPVSRPTGPTATRPWR